MGFIVPIVSGLVCVGVCIDSCPCTATRHIQITLHDTCMGVVGMREGREGGERRGEERRGEGEDVGGERKGKQLNLHNTHKCTWSFSENKDSQNNT